MKISKSMKMVLSLCLTIMLVSFYPAFAADISNPTAVASGTIIDDTNGFTVLDGVYGITTVVISGSTYALAASFNDNGVQIIDISDPSNPTAVSTIIDGATFTELGGARVVITVVISGSTYALVAGQTDNGVQIIDISDPSNPTAVASGTIVDGTNGFTELDDVRAITTVVISGSTYALAAAYDDDGVQIINISDPSNPTAVAAIDDEVGGFTVLDRAHDITTVVIGSNTYALVASYDDDGVQIIDISTPSNPTLVGTSGFITDGNNGFAELNGAQAITTVVIGSNTYALVVGSADDGVQIIDISTPSNPTAVAAIADGVNGFTELFSTQGITTVVIDGSTYALVTSYLDNGVQIIDISDPSNPTAVASGTIIDDTNGFTELSRARGITTVVINGSTYALVASSNDNGVQIIDINTVANSSTTTTTSNGDSGNKHNTKPTFGLDHKTGMQLIEGGFTFNDNSFDITDNFWVPFDEKHIQVGETNTFSVKVFANQKLKIQEFLFGIPNINESHKAELGIEVYYDYFGDLEKVNVVQKTKIINPDSIVVENLKSKCLPDEKDEKCSTTKISLIFLEPLQYNIMAIKAIDFKHRTQITYFNNGFNISGDSLNPMNTKMMPDPQKYVGLIKITQTEKYSDIWITDDGREFEGNEFGSFKQINKSFGDVMDLDEIKKLEFLLYKEDQINKAKIILAQICEFCFDEPFDKINTIFSYDYPDYLETTNDPTIQYLLLVENLKAKEKLLKLYGNNMELD